MRQRAFGFARRAARRRMRAVAGLFLIVSVLHAGATRANGWEHGAIPFRALIEALGVEDATTRTRAAQSLGYRGQAEAVEPLLRALARPEDDPGVRSAIYGALGALGDPRALPVLRACLSDETRQELRGDCAAALGALADPDGMADLLHALESDSSILVRSRAVDALGFFSAPRAVAALAALSNEGAPRALRPRAIRALGRTGSPRAAASLLDALARAKQDAERIDIVAALMHLGAPAAAGPLTDLLAATADPTLRALIAAALGAGRDGSALPTLVRMVGEESLPVRFVALGALRELRRAEAAGPIARLAAQIEARLDTVDDAALVADAAQYRAALALETEALRAASELDPAAGLAVLLRAARARPMPRDSAAALEIAQAIYERRRAALYGLGYTGAADAAPVLAGADGLGDPDPRLRAVAVRALGVLGRPDAAAVVAPRLRDKSAEVRWTAAAVLGRLADRSAIGPLRAALGDPVAEVRRQAALGLGYLAAGEARAELARLASTDGNPQVRDAAGFAVRLLGDGD